MTAEFAGEAVTYEGLKLLGGALTVANAPGRGTRVEAAVALR